MKTKTPLHRTAALFALALLATFAATQETKAQYQITTLGGTITENFNGMTIPSTSGPIAFNASLNDNSNTTQAQRNSAWTFMRTITSVGNDNGSNTSGGYRAYGINGTATDRSLGALGSGSFNNVSGFTAQFTNVSGTTITSLVLTSFAEQWRLVSAGRAANITLTYSTTDATSGFSSVLATYNASNSGTTGAVNGDNASFRGGVNANINNLTEHAKTACYTLIA